MIKLKDILGYNKIQNIFALYVLIWSITPPIQFGTLFRVIAVISVSMWLLLSLSKNFEGKKIFVSLIVAIVSFGLLAPLFRHFGGEPYGLCFTKNMNILIFLLNGAITVYYLLNDRRFLVSAFWVCIFLFTIFSLTTLYAYQTMPGVSRQLVKASEDNVELAKMGVGGYGHVYSMLFVVITVLYLFIYESKKIFKIVYLAIAALGSVLIFQSGYLTSNILLLVIYGLFFSGVFLLNDYPKILRNFIVVGIIAVSFAGTISAYRNNIINALDGTLYQAKVEDIFMSIDNNESEGKLEGRTSRYSDSFVGQFKYCITGAYIFDAEDEIGGHSTLMDMLAYFGIASIGFYISIKNILVRISQDCQDKGYFFVTVIIFLALGFLNTYSMHIGVSAFLLTAGATTYIKGNYN